jgi:hypothetical protein
MGIPWRAAELASCTRGLVKKTSLATKSAPGRRPAKTCEDRIDLAAGAGVEEIGLQSHCASSRFDISNSGLNSGTDRTHEDGYTSDRRYQLAQEFQPFCG